MSKQAAVLTVEQIAWVLERLSEHLNDGGTFRKMVERLGHGADAYEALMSAGGVEIANILDFGATMDEMDAHSVACEHTQSEPLNVDENKSN